MLQVFQKVRYKNLLIDAGYNPSYIVIEVNIVIGAAKQYPSIQYCGFHLVF